MDLGERIREITLPTSGGITGSILSVNMCNVLDTMLYAAVGAAVGILINEIWKLIKSKWNERNKRDKTKD
mgnify:CR=1 FL=1